MVHTSLNHSTSHYMNSTSPTGLHGLPLWYQYPLCAGAPYGFIFYYGVKMFNLVVGAPCNFLVIWQIATKKSDASTSDIFIFNLAVLDTYFCLMTPVELVNHLLLDDSRIWYFQRFAYGLKDLAVLFLVCICLDRYTAVVHPVLFSGIRDNRIRTGICVVVWGLILAYAVSKCILGSKSVNSVFSGAILFTFTIMVFCNISIIWVLRRTVAGNGARHPVKQKAFKMVLTILAIIVVNYLPPVALMPFASYYTFVEFNCQIRTSVFSIMDLSCSIEPLLYLTKMEFMDGCRCRFTEKTQDVAT
ncbi:G-protein coupled receptor 35-like [Takifugu flavidus]|uniref:Lysophosphatidic acid receptor 4 n=1 Tax=Takifugu flavidus TaxID=433684 RepID=A0A5C6MUM2_9TELE|nr:G-protein coupled receptor 35-like [Takifugu flavidus]TWW58974.1 Lysophosphatidic acid receptor 4 [Takifugu flavidus]